MMRPLLTTAAVLATVPALAQMPDYDTARRCAEFAKGNRAAEIGCRRNEADARRELDKSRISTDVLASCNEQVQGEQSYVLLYGCTLSATAAKGDQRRTAPIPVGPMNAPAPAVPMNVPALNNGPASRPAP